jgi:competence protein ComEC
MNWSTLPALKILAFFILGIVFQEYVNLPVTTWLVLCFSALSIVFLFRFASITLQYRFRVARSLALLLAVTAAGAVLCYTRDVRHQPSFYGNLYREGDTVLLTLTEPLVEKARTYKAEATVSAVYHHHRFLPAKGKVIVYLPKNDLPPGAGYGSVLCTQQPLQAIRNAGNPGGFDYARFCRFRQVMHQVFLKPGCYTLTESQNDSRFQQFLFRMQVYVNQTIQRYVAGRQEQGVAEALLIGYKYDLDKSIVQAYTNSGVIHIIAISGLHLGMIYWVLNRLLGRLKRHPTLRWLRPVLILSVLWLFTLLTGAAPSILRSAVMFSFLILGEVIGRKTNPYNMLAASAFGLLLINPFYLWDVGFQLSYAALTGIGLFSKPVEKRVYVQNRLLRMLWQLAVASTAAQLMTFPLVCLYFHQFPVYFLFTNLVAVPLSGLALAAIVALFAVAWWPAAAGIAGMANLLVIKALNAAIMHFSKMPFSLCTNISLTWVAALWLSAAILAGGILLANPNRSALFTSLLCLGGFAFTHCIHRLQLHYQRRIVVYNVPKCSAIDLIEGNCYTYLGSAPVHTQQPLFLFHLQPARIALQACNSTGNLLPDQPVLRCGSRKLLLLDDPADLDASFKQFHFDAVILSNNVNVDLAGLLEQVRFSTIVTDNTNALWKIRRWEKEAQSLDLRIHSLPGKGAFILDY